MKNVVLILLKLCFLLCSGLLITNFSYDFRIYQLEGVYLSDLFNPAVHHQVWVHVVMTLLVLSKAALLGSIFFREHRVFTAIISSTIVGLLVFVCAVWGHFVAGPEMIELGAVYSLLLVFGFPATQRLLENVPGVDKAREH